MSVGRLKGLKTFVSISYEHLFFAFQEHDKIFFNIQQLRIIKNIEVLSLPVDGEKIIALHPHATSSWASIKTFDHRKIVCMISMNDTLIAWVQDEWHDGAILTDELGVVK